MDEKGRLKLPVPFQQYLGAFGETRLFVTSLDGRIARIYPNSVWKDNENFFAGYTANPKYSQEVQFVANHYGADGEVDGQGRVLIPTVLRRKLNMENDHVWLQCSSGPINIYSKGVYEALTRQAEEDIEMKLQELVRSGLR